MPSIQEWYASLYPSERIAVDAVGLEFAYRVCENVRARIGEREWRQSEKPVKQKSNSGQKSVFE